ncbi:enoyl-CoA hydratase [Anoxybacillus sp. UARK-01]|uniref:enoyl-CoA hydratase/isomerase family protein n=1 Tax=Anoxybacillus sp. UARK-01 TaxID=1895648 RepID=UPI0009BC64BF|nr:enoyl-CoA hydratase-related protein [Anoxybacillus sp. UARK-01]OQM45936.1 enoyl-CoA hydratase [Anoxybacillus sp. UARK-01]
MTDELYVQKQGKIAVLVINRPQKKNAFTLAMFQKLKAILDELETDQEIRVLIIRGVDETAFSAGADIHEFLEIRFSEEKAKKYNDVALAAVEKLYRFSRPTIALIQGLAIGGGLELANACDFRFATENSQLGITAANIGIVYNLTSTKRLYHLVGPAKTKELLYTAKRISALEGKAIGLVDYLYPNEEIEEKCLQFAEQIITKSSVSIIGMKKVIQAIMDGEHEESEEISEMILSSYSSDDYKEGIQAFIEKRNSRF